MPRGAYHERAATHGGWLDTLSSHMKLARLGASANPRFLQRFVRRVGSHEPVLDNLGAKEIAQEARELRLRFKSYGITANLAARSFGLVRAAATSALGQRHHDVQLIGGWCLLRGMVAEMETGEGKTLTAVLPACTAALAGVPVHIITVNDYLATRDAGWMRAIYEALGLRVGVVTHGLEPQARREAYACDVTYSSNKEIAFDYLKDRLTLGHNPSRLHLQLERLAGGPTRESRLLLRGLRYAIVDEVDSVLIDEARTPLIISRNRSSVDERNAYKTALTIAGKMRPGLHFKVDEHARLVHLTDGGREKLEELVRSSGTLRGIWARPQRRRDIVLQALTAKYLYLRDRQYLIKDESVQIIDEYTGRTMPDRSWEHGLHQAIEAKENCPVTAQNEPVARVSYQRFFRRYLHLAGMTGTAREVAGELAAVYGLATIRVPTHRPLKRLRQATSILLTAEKKWEAILTRIESVHKTGRPILIGTRSVEASERLGRLLEAAGLPHQVLNARQDETEAEIIARAGEPWSITVATNMAGRGTDIQLKGDAAERGGLHVIASELHEAGRIDRQLYGRCGRQGDPGSYEAILSLEDDLVRNHGSKFLRRTAAKKLAATHPSPPRVGEFLFRCAQRTAENRHRRMRLDLLRIDDFLTDTLAFSGVPE